MLKKSGTVYWIGIAKVAGAIEILQALAATLAAAIQERITPEEGQTVAAILELYRKSMETTDLEAR